MTNEGYFKPSTAEPSGPEFGESPLRDFWSTGAGYEVKGGTATTGNPWQRVYFRGIVGPGDVLECIEVYPLPSSEISIFYSDPARTPKRRSGQGTNEWEVFSESIRAFYGDRPDALDDLFGGQVVGEGTMPTKPGKRMRMIMTLSAINVSPKACQCKIPNDKWHDEQKLAWRVVEVEGMSAVSADGAIPNTPAATSGTDLQTYVLNLADGKDQATFYAAALDDAKVLGNPGLVVQLSERAFIDQMVQLGQLTQDEKGVLHIVTT